MARELMPKSGIMMPHVVVTRDAAVVGVSTVDGQAGAIDLTGKYLQKTDAAATYQTKTEGASKDFVLDSIQPIMSGALFREDPWVVNDTPFRSTGANGVESVDMMKVTPDNSIKIGSYASSVQGVEIHSAGRLQVVDQNDSGVETKYPVYSKRYRPEIEDLPFAAIGSYVKDSKGRTIGVTRTGINSDIKQLTQKVTFTQPVTIPDAVGDYDAVTLRQLRNSGGGSGGPTMSGISNFGIGDFRLVDSRAFIQSNDVTSDGQLLNRADYPELWAYAQLLTPISDADWLADPQKRGKYSLGNGTTTFRVPDRNGVQTGSISGLYARGDVGNSANNGTVQQNAAPDITGATVSAFSTSTSLWDVVSGAFDLDQGNTVTQVGNQATIATSGAARKANMSFKASRSAASYGRDNTTEVRTNSFVGVWVIRASGGFVAANTSWSVINGDAAAPANGTLVRGGNVVSEYDVAGAKKYSAELLSQAQYGVGKSAAVIRATDHISNQTKDLVFETNGTLTVPGAIKSTSTVSGEFLDSTGIGYGGGLRRLAAYAAADANSVNQVYYVENAGSRTVCYQVTIPGQSYQHVWRIDHDGQNKYFSIRSDNNMYTPLGAVAIQGSDVRIKDNFEEPKEGAWDRVKSIGICEFKYKGQNVTQRGFLAQQMGEIDPVYTFEGGTAHDDDGNEFEIINVNDKAVLADVITVMQMMQDKIEAMESEIAELKSNK